MLEFFKKVVVTFMITAVLFIVDSGNFVEAQTSGSFGNGTEGQFCTATIDQSLMNQRSRKYAYVKLNIYKIDGKLNNWRNVEITMRDENNNVIWQGIHSGGKLKLGNDHRVYRIYVRDHKASKTFAPGNVDCQRWSIEVISGCSID